MEEVIKRLDRIIELLGNGKPSESNKKAEKKSVSKFDKYHNRWTPEEDAILLEDVPKGYSWEVICTTRLKGRTPAAARVRYGQIKPRS